MNNLKEFQAEMPNGFDSIAVDITGFCNAKCKYCPSGGDLTNSGKFITLERFELILKKLIEYKFYSPLTNFHIYALGEPCLHPQINDILKLLLKYQVVTVISTNASVIPEFDRGALKAVSRFLISVPGFSQESYDKIHGFNFERIKANIIKLRENVSELSGNRIAFDMSYHIYQFNEAEMELAREFCKKHDIRFAPNYAVLMDKDRCMDYASGNMSSEELKDISKDIFLGVLDQQMKDAPRNYCDIQNSFLSMTVDGDVRICSGFTRRAEPNILVGNILTDDIDEIVWRKFHHPKCEACIKAGLTPSKTYECKVYPNGYYELMKENDFVLEHLKDENLPEKLELMKMVRKFEYEGYPKELKASIEEYAAERGLQSELEQITLNYTRFGIKTYQMIVA